MYEEIKSKRFSGVYYVELGPEEALAVVKSYNEEAHLKGVDKTVRVDNFIRRTTELRLEDEMYDSIGELLPNFEETDQKTSNSILSEIDRRDGSSVTLTLKPQSSLVLSLEPFS